MEYDAHNVEAAVVVVVHNVVVEQVEHNAVVEEVVAFVVVDVEDVSPNIADLAWNSFEKLEIFRKSFGKSGKSNTKNSYF